MFVNKKNLALTILVVFQIAFGQVTLTRNYFYDLQAYNFLDFDLQNSANNPDFFSYTLAYNPANNEPVEVVLELSFSATLPGYGFQNTNIAHVKSRPFPFLGTVTLSSLDIDQNMDNITYSDRNEEVEYKGNEIEDFISDSDLNTIRENVLATGELPAGQYVFTIKVFQEGMLAGSDQKIISISATNRLELIEPGDELGSDVEIQTTYPIFRWDTEAVRYDENYCSECGIYLRVAEYIPDEHGSLQEALNSEASLPFPDNKEFVRLAAINSNQSASQTVNNFIYPVSEAKPLERGHYYVWQVKKRFPTTAGFDEVESNIFVFKVAEESGLTAGSEAETMVNDFIFSLIENLKPEDLEKYKKELENYRFSGEILLDNQTISTSELQTILNKISGDEYFLESIIIK